MNELTFWLIFAVVAIGVGIAAACFAFQKAKDTVDSAWTMVKDLLEINKND